MTSFVTLGVTLILIAQVYGRPSKFPANPLANDMAYDMAKRVYKSHAFDSDKNDDSSPEGYADHFKYRYTGGRTKEEDEVNSHVGVPQMTDTGHDDSMFKEQAIPSENLLKNHPSNDQMIYNEVRRLGLNENDDSSVESYETLFQDQLESQAKTSDDGTLGPVHDDSISEGHQFLAHHQGKDSSDLRDVLSKRGRPRIPCHYCCTYKRCADQFDHICQCSD